MNDYPNDRPNDRPADRLISVGEVDGAASGALPRLRADGPAMRRVAGRPWMRALVARQLGSPYHSRYQPRREASVSDRALGHHSLIVGSSGSGKTRLSLRLITEQLRLGRSLVMLDPKTGTIEHALAAAMEAGVPPERVTLVTPGDLSRGLPGWNPLATGLPIHLAAAELVSVFNELYKSSWGPRMSDILSNALVLLAAHGLSLFEVGAFLNSDAVRDAVLSRRPATLGVEDSVAYDVAESFFRQEFDAVKQAERSAMTAAVTNKTRGLLRSAFLQFFFCPQANTLDFARLWERQEVVLIHIDDSVLGKDAASIVSATVAHCIHNTAMRVGGPGTNPVVLCVDEMGVQNPCLTDILAKVLAVAREKRLRLMAVCQHLGQVDPYLRQSLLSQSMVQAFFNLGDSDADIVAGALAAGEEDHVGEATVRPEGDDEETGRPRLATWEQQVLDGNGNGVDLDPAAWEAMRRRDLLAPLARQPYVRPSPLDDLRRIAAAAGIPRLYVICPDTGQPVEVGEYLRGVSDVEYCFRGPREVKLAITVPRPKVTNVSRVGPGERSRDWARKLAKLPRRHAVLRVRDGHSDAVVVRVADVPDLGPGERARTDEFARQALALRGRSAGEATREARERSDRIDRMMSGQPVSGPSAPGNDGKAPYKQQAGGERPEPIRAADQPADAGGTYAASEHAKPARPPRGQRPATVGRIADDGSVS